MQKIRITVVVEGDDAKVALQTSDARPPDKLRLLKAMAAASAELARLPEQQVAVEVASPAQTNLLLGK